MALATPPLNHSILHSAVGREGGREGKRGRWGGEVGKRKHEEQTEWEKRREKGKDEK